MIKKITKIKNLGIFENWKPATEFSFTKYNLLYGWNGSGKSTLSKLFRAIELKQSIDEYKKCEFEIELIDEQGSSINQSFETPVPIIKVFNQSFIKANTELEKGEAKSIIYIGKENTDLKKEIDALIIEHKKIGEDFFKAIELYKSSTKTEDEFYKNAGETLRAFFRNTIFSNSNYDKRDTLRIWQQIKDEPSLKDCVLKDNIFENKKTFIAQNKSVGKITLKYNTITTGFDDTLYKEVCDIVRTKPVIKTIERLKKNNDIANWVQKGIEIHHNHQSNNCEFCGKQLDDEKLAELSEHFNQEFKNLQNAITAKKAEIQKFYLKELTVNKQLFYSEYHIKIDETVDRINECVREIKKGLDFYNQLLDSKFQNPIKTDFTTKNIGSTWDIFYNQEIEILNAIIEHQNKRVDEFEKEAEECKLQLEKHFVAEKAITDNFKNLLGSIIIQQKDKDEKRVADSKMEMDIYNKQLQLQNDLLPIDLINKNLHKFLARNDISLTKDEDGGYLLKRGNFIALNLSEGEKTAIALVYFIVKLNENDNNVKDSIIVFDDPISSFDSNHLFNAFTFITENCKESKQLFVLTHNFWFFKLVRDWMQKKNKKDKNATAIIKSTFYEIKYGDIIPANQSLLSYHSEYHYVFKKLFDFKLNQNLTQDDSFTLANAARRVLESFSAFKKPDEAGIQGALTMAKSKGVDAATTEKIYYFLNKYSHLDRIETHENTIENIEHEGTTIVNDILNIINKIDPDHFKSMETICTKN